MEKRFITIVDIGSYRISVCTAAIEGKDISIVAHKDAHSEGVKRGIVFNPRQAAEVTGSLIKEIENELGIKISNVVTGIPGYGITNRDLLIEKNAADPDCITTTELNAMTAEAYNRTENENEKIYAAIPQSYRVSDIIDISYDDAVGMASETIEGKYRLLAGNKNIFSGNERVFKNLGINISGKALYSIASAESTLLDQEKYNGVALIEFGGNTTNLVIYYRNTIRYVYTLPFGGNNITHDIANECRITTRLAESIKRDFGNAMPDKLAINSEKSIQIKGRTLNDIEIPVKYLAEIINARCQEIFDAIFYKIEESGYAEQLSSGIVLTGGEANLMCITDFIKSLSGYPVRRAMPSVKIDYSGFSKLYDYSYASLTGLLKLVMDGEITLKGTDSASTYIEQNRQAGDEETTDNETEVTDDTAGQIEEKPEKTEKKRKTTWLKDVFFGKDADNENA